MKVDCRDEGRWCYFHPRELLVGVCALCLNERLLVLQASSKQETNTIRFTPKRVLPMIFALTNLLNRNSDNKRRHIMKSEVHDSTNSSACSTQEDSFISIKFEENGVASWDKGKISKISHDHQQQCEIMSCNESLDKKKKKIKSVVEHSKPHTTTLRWRRRIGQLFQLTKWKRSSKGSVCHVGTKLEGAKVKYGWIRILTKKRTKE